MAHNIKIATWNINSIRSRIDQVVHWLQSNNIDIALLQELKCTNDQFPYSLIEELGYNCYVFGEKSYNGVAIISKFSADETFENFLGSPCPNQARYIEATMNLPIGYTRISSVYVPNGGEVDSDKFKIKMDFYDAFSKYISTKQDLDENFIIGGDFNVALNDSDVYSPDTLRNTTCFTNIERKKLRSFINVGFRDPEEYFSNKNLFTWWDYRAQGFQNNKGLRIDYIFSNPKISDKITNYYCQKEIRGNIKASDHAPVIIEYEY